MLLNRLSKQDNVPRGTLSCFFLAPIFNNLPAIPESHIGFVTLQRKKNNYVPGV